MVISSWPPCYDAPKPYHYEEVLEVSRILSKVFPFVRVDFIDTADRLYVGELTFYPSGGLCIYEPRGFDAEIGSHYNIPELKCDYVKVGVALYGVLSSPDDRTKIDLDLRPVLALKTKIVLIRLVNAGESVGYNRKFRAGRDRQPYCNPSHRIW